MNSPDKTRLGPDRYRMLVPVYWFTARYGWCTGTDTRPVPVPVPVPVV